MKENHITFRSGDLSIEGLLAIPGGADTPAPGAVICHPHPMYGGSMHNNVVDAILDAMWRLGYATLRFNFRGVGASEGEYDGGVGESDDARAAVAYLSSHPGVRADRVVLAGYSFGAAIAMRAGFADAGVEQIVAVALPVAMMDSGASATATKPILMVSGDADDYSPVAGLRSVAAQLGKSARVEIIAGADHFFGGYEGDLAAAIEGALAGR